MKEAARLSAQPLDLVDFEPLERRLISEFCPPLRPEEVQRCLVGAVANFQSATVHNYLPVLIERETRGRLKAVSRARTE